MNQNFTSDPSSLFSESADLSEVCFPSVHRVWNTELSGDFSLPDYQPEIKRLLRITTQVSPPEHYISGDSMDLDGTLDYFVLYMGNDNRLYCAPLSSDYHLTLSLSDARETAFFGLNTASGHQICTFDLCADTVTGRVTAPRRLNLKCKLRSGVRIYESADQSADFSHIGDVGSVEQLTETTDYCHLQRMLGDPLPLQDDMLLDRDGSANTRVICAEGKVMVQEAISGQNTVTCRGDVYLKLTTVAENTADDPLAPTVTLRKLPFSQVIEVPGVTPDWRSCASGICSDLSVETEDGHLHTELRIVLEVLSQKNQKVSYVKDLYSVKKSTNCTYTSYPVQRALDCFNGNFTFSDTLSLSDVGIPATAKILDVTGTVYPDTLTADPERERCILAGRCRFHILMQKEGEYAFTEVELPFRYEKETALDINAVQGAEIPHDGQAQAIICRARMDGERLGLDAEISVALRTMAEASLTAVSAVDEGADITRGRGEYVICFPAADDSLWSVAKRYHAPMAALSAANGISPSESPQAPETLNGIRYLIV